MNCICSMSDYSCLLNILYVHGWFIIITIIVARWKIIFSRAAPSLATQSERHSESACIFRYSFSVSNKIEYNEPAWVCLYVSHCALFTLALYHIEFFLSNFSLSRSRSMYRLYGVGNCCSFEYLYCCCSGNNEIGDVKFSSKSSWHFSDTHVYTLSHRGTRNKTKVIKPSKHSKRCTSQTISK